MFTYVINTSGNKTFDSDKLFDLAGYNRIAWKNCRLDEIGDCAKEIMEKQNVLAADAFSVAIIVDFYGFDRIRPPYGREGGFVEEKGVDLSLYTPYIEAYIADKMISYLEKYELVAERYDVYYVQSEKFERYEFLDNAREQLHYILDGKADTACAVRDDISAIIEQQHKQRKEERAEVLRREGKTDESVKEALQLLDEELKAEAPALREQLEKELVPYSTFSLYCTPDVTLDFDLLDYPYGTSETSLTFDEFFTAFRERISHRPRIRHYHYLTKYGGGAIRAAFDTLCLSLFLVYIYEREEVPEGSDMEVAHLDSTALRDVLVTAWSKIAVARTVAAENRSNYFSLDQNVGDIARDLELRKNADPETEIMNERNKLKREIKEKKISADTMFRSILKHADKTRKKLDAEKQAELDALISSYLQKRDDTSESSVEADFEEQKNMGAMRMTQQCPSKADFQRIMEKKEKEISALFETALAAEYIDVDYTEEKEKAKAAYKEYDRIRACMRMNFLADILFLVLSVFIAIMPYDLLQLSHTELFVFSASLLHTTTLAFFGGMFLLSLGIHIFLFARQLKKQKDILRECYLTCLSKERYSFSAIRNRYQKDLIRIEEARYEIRLLKHLYEANIKKDRNITLHRNMLEEIQDNLSSMLSHMEVEMVYDPNESVFGEFDLTKSFRAKDNKIYQIFSIETIEKMFRKKGSDDR